MAKKSNGLGISPDVAVIGGIAILGYAGVLNSLLKWIGIKKDDDTKQQEQQQQAAVQSTKAALVKTGMKQQLTDAVISQYVEVIHNSLRYSSLDDDYDKAALYLCTPKNDLDVLRMIELFGIRKECYFGVICYDETLGEMVNKNLSKAKLTAINENYARKGMKFRW